MLKITMRIEITLKDRITGENRLDSLKSVRLLEDSIAFEEVYLRLKRQMFIDTMHEIYNYNIHNLEEEIVSMHFPKFTEEEIEL